MTAPHLLSRLTIEAHLTPETAPGFRLGADTLGTGQLGDAATASREWVPIVDEAIEVQITRGGEREGVTVAAEVGTLTVTAVDSTVMQRIRPSTPVRVRRLRDPIGGYGMMPYGHEPYGGHDPATRADLQLFTGTVLDLRTSWERMGHDLSEIRAITTLTAVDAVHQLANTARYGAVITYENPWQEIETLGQRAQRLLGGTGLPYRAPDPTPIDWITLATYQRWQTTGFGMGYNADETRHGVVGFYWEPGEQYNEPTINVTMDPPAPGRIAAGVWARLMDPTPATPRQVALELHEPLWPAGSVLRASQTYDLPADGSWRHLTISGVLEGSLGAEIVVRSTSAGHAATEGTGINATGLTVSAGSCMGTGYALGSLVYESTLANHLDVAVNSVRGAWWVDATGTIQVRGCRHSEDSPPLLLSDQPGAGWSFVGIEHAFDTAGIVNELTLDNHGRQRDPDNPAQFIADDRRLGPYRDWTSTAAYGFRAADVSTGLAYTRPELPMFNGQEERLADEYLAVSALAEPKPLTVRLFRNPNDPPLPSFDVMSPVDIEFRGKLYHCAVARIEHEITRYHWHTNLTLIERA